MGYLLPIPNFQANQDLIRSWKKKERFSYIHPVQNVNLQYQLNPQMNRQHSYTNMEYWRKIPRLKIKMINIPPHNSSDDLVFWHTVGGGLYFDFYV
ncbi:hypothetical protein [Rummeliibacillus sp. POC4]|uniref:hypothetical protein n=1 Tax=Rummeliibacillus sp. POC4 TaxID=2305899 RepID=UPI000E6612BE|nr:hypothetical protein [Rummeliibacillus sp. POC4]RIJ67679.1 hypothetical protein D1606_03735 [Rummeliibacillus sp. POC4]